MITNDGISKKYTSTGKHSGYETTLFHSGLNEYRHLSAREKYQLRDKIHNAQTQFEKKWDRLLAAEEREMARLDKLSKKEQSEDRTREASEIQNRLGRILEHTLSIDDTIDWKKLYPNTSFSTDTFRHIENVQTKRNGYPKSITKVDKLPSPNREEHFKPISFWKKVLGKKTIVLAQQQTDFEAAVSKVNEENLVIDSENINREGRLKELQTKHDAELKLFEEEQKRLKSSVDEFKNSYFEKSLDAVEEYCSLVLDNSEYSEDLPKDFDLQYIADSKILIVEFKLPDIDEIPSLVSVNYVATRDQFTEKHLSAAAKNKLYDNVIYQITLRTVHELFEADSVQAIDAISFNGIVTSLNPANGKMETKCIVSLSCKKDEFEEINLAAVEPKACFKSLKGVAASKLSSLTPIKPILAMNRQDKRFTDSYDVADALDETTNLAAMDWEDFEHLIREVFAKQFSEGGGEVKVTKASRDGGVDAIAFDPDPIRGGKIVIQAKRYTNLVSVSAVRDLFGTVTSEGANKGILVTTADYGPDAYAFAKDKPLTLLNGSNLLHLLESHGHKARINIAEAKKLMKQV